MRIDWFSQLLRRLSRKSQLWMQSPLSKRKTRRPRMAQLEALEERAMLSGNGLLDNLLNIAPVGVPDTFNVIQNTPLNSLVSVLANDTDANNDTLNAHVVVGPLHGIVNLRTDGTFTYTPNPNYTGPDSFLYLPNDGTLSGLLPTLVTLDILPPLNLAPVGVPDSYELVQDTTLNAVVSVLSNDTDGNGDLLNALVVAGPAHGILNLNLDGTFTYIPDLGFTGLDSFLYLPNDGTLSGLIPTLVNLDILPLVNTPPVANNDTFSVLEDSILNLSLGTQLDGVLANDTDADGNLLLANLVTTTQHGSLVFLPTGTFIYTPNPNFVGTDTFTYQASDLQSQSNIATVTFVVGAVNDAPVAVNDNYSTALLGSLTVTTANGVLANDSDADGGPLTATVVTPPLLGTLSFNPDGSFVYTPLLGVNAVDTFTYRASDGTTSSNLAVVTISILGSNNTPPVANNDSYSTTEDTPFVAVLNGVLANDTDANGDVLTAVLVSQPAHGTVVFLPTGAFTYTPNANYSGPDSFTYRASDGLAVSNVATVALTVGAVNDPPVAINDSYATTTNTALTVPVGSGILANDTDAEGSALTAAVVGQPTHGNLVLNANGSFTYTPTAGFAGTVSFTYRANDGTANSNLATVTITIAAGANSAPVAVNDSYTLSEDSSISVTPALGVLSNDTDANSDALTAILVSQPSHGTVTLAANGSFVYTPSANYSGPDSFTYQASDGTANSNVATVNLTINGVNDAPVAVNDTYGTATDTALVVLAANGVLSNDTDSDGQSLTAATVSLPANGTLALNNDGSFTYTPDAGFAGTDSFSYRSSDGIAVSNIATVTITVSAVANSAPVAVNDSYTFAEDTTLTISAGSGVLSNDTDADGDPLTVNIVAQPAHGSLTLGANGAFVYTPNSNFSGSDSFTYQATDGFANSNVALVTLTITGTNDAPSTSSDNYSTAANTQLIVAAGTGVLANDADPDGQGITAAVVALPPNGTLTLNSNGGFTYTPNAGFIGVDVFTYAASDGTLSSGPTTVTITVTSQTNAVPVAANDSYTVTEDTTLTIANANGVLSNDSDANGDPLTAAVVTQPSHGTITLSANGSFVYTPDANFSGSDSFTYLASDGVTNSNVATVTFTVTGVSDAPVANSDTYSATPNVVLTVNAGNGVLANDSDADGDTLTATVVSTTPNGTLNLNANGSFTYTPNVGFHGVDVFTYSASDGSTSTGATTVMITVSGAPNSVPVAASDSYTIAEDTVLSTNAGGGVLANDTDADGDTLTALIVTQPVHGTVVISANGSFVYTPDAGFNGSDSFTYQASDGLANSGVATVSVTVTAVNDAPVAASDSYSTNEDTPLNVTAALGVLANDSDPDLGATLTAVLIANPTHGTLVLNGDGSFSYTPAANYQGSDSFTYHVSDGTTTSGNVTVTLSINAVNDVPQSIADSYVVNEDGVLTVPVNAGVLANDSDADGNPLTAAVVSQPQNGTLTLNSDGSLIYTPNPNFQGSDSFTYRANDGAANGDTVTVSITVNGVNDAPSATSDSYAVNEDAVLTVPAASGVLANDTDPDVGSTLSAAVVTNPLHGTVTLNGDGSFIYTPAANFQGTDSFTYRVSDGVLNSSPVTVSLTVNTLNDLPVAVADSYTVNEDTVLTVQVANGLSANDTDADADPLTAIIVSQPQSGTITLNPNGSFVYTPNSNFSGADSFTYRVSDGTGNSNIVTVTLNVNALNDLPVGVNDIYIVNEDSVLALPAASGVLANDTDADPGSTLTAVLVTNPAHGTLTLNGDGSLIYTPNANFTGSDSFTYRVNDGTGNSGNVTVTLTVNATNDVPVSANDSYTVAEDSVLNVPVLTGVLANDSDGDSDPLTVTVVTPPQHGALTLNPDGSFVYTPAADFNGADTFTYRANDGTGDGNLATVTVTVGEANEAPVVTTTSGVQTAKGRKRIVVDPPINLTDADSTNFGGGSFDVRVQSGVGGNDTLGYRRGGANRGRVNVRKNELRIGKLVIGTYSGGTKGAPLHVDLNSNATLDRVKTALQNLTFRGSKATAGPRVISFQVKDETGLSSNVATKGVNVV